MAYGRNFGVICKDTTPNQKRIAKKHKAKAIRNINKSLKNALKKGVEERFDYYDTPNPKKGWV